MNCPSTSSLELSGILFSLNILHHTIPCKREQSYFCTCVYLEVQNLFAHKHWYNPSRLSSGLGDCVQKSTIDVISVTVYRKSATSPNRCSLLQLQQVFQLREALSTKMSPFPTLVAGGVSRREFRMTVSSVTTLSIHANSQEWWTRFHLPGQLNCCLPGAAVFSRDLHQSQ